MMRWQRLLQAIALTLSMTTMAWADDSPSLRVTARLQDAAQAQVGGTVQLELQVMTPTWFTQPPRLPELELPGVIVTPPSGHGAIVRDQQDGVAYSGLRYTYLLSPTAAGALHVPALTVSAQVGPGGSAVTASSEPMDFNVGGGSGVAGDVAAAELTITQDYALEPDPLVKGGRVTRSITQRAQGMQAMLLPAAPLEDVAGFKRYPREPEVTTLTDTRGGFIGGQRIDRADYVAEETGTLHLPDVIMQWRDASSGQREQQALSGREFVVTVSPLVDPPFSLTDDLAQLRHGLRWVLPVAWLAWVVGGGFAALMIWLGWPWWRRGIQKIRLQIQRASARRKAGEPWHWRVWRRAASRGAVSDTASISAFYRWLGVITGASDMRAATRQLDAPNRQAVETALRAAYGNPNGGKRWRAGLAAASRQWRRLWRTRQKPTPAYTLPAAVNPVPVEQTGSFKQTGAR
ncbi:hypothetical protein [Bordetella tumulicola]|uniref:hypothetical protein n=1 Tax=Bordetella tumulicola TaxID=1649133 RepID=UPI0039EF6C4C